MTERVPVAVGGVGGSGTRLVARILSDAGMFIGDDLNRSLDNLWFKLLFDRPRWLPERLRRDDDPAVGWALDLFRRAMTDGLHPSATDRAVVARATWDLAVHGHDVDGTGRGRWGLERGRSLLRAGGHDRDAFAGWGWKEPSATFLAGPLRTHLGRVRYVHVIRHGLDAAFSLNETFRTWAPLYGLDPRQGPPHLVSLRFWLAANERAVAVGRERYGEDFLLVRLEELSNEPERGVRRLLHFAGVEVPEDRIAALASLPSLPPTAGRYRQLDPSTFPPGDIERVRALGYEVDAPVRARRTRRRATSDGALRLSVALCTYQGERFLAEQLDSIASQTRPPDELVAFDDGSSDGTVDLLESFGGQAPFPVKVLRNERTLGSTKNFEQAIEAATGDVIALADQDDVWHDRKLEVTEAAFADGGVAAVFSDADLIDERSRSTGAGLWDTLGFSMEMRRRIASGDAVPVLVRGNVVTGAAMAFRSSFRDLIVPIPAGWVQDAWIALLLGAAGRLQPVEEPLIRYRVHPAQQIGVPRPRTGVEQLRHRLQVIRRTMKQERPALLEQARAFALVAERLRDMAERYPVPPAALDEIEGKVRHFRARGTMPSEPNRWRTVSAEWTSGGYRRWSNGWVSAAKDLVLPDRFGASGSVPG